MTARPIDLICAPKPTSAKVAPAAQNGTARFFSMLLRHSA
jgi:hypothetical protein